jgi:site-specific DNA-methyltransferase (adenine-specific)
MLSAVPGQVGAAVERTPPSQLGRWPANILHDGSDEVLAVFPESVGQIADISISTSSSSRKNQNVYGAMARGNGREGEASADSDNEGAVGFKMRPGARREDTGSAARFFYCGKATRADRNAGMEGMPERVVSVWGGEQDDLSDGKKATRASANHHPTVKPTEVMRWLVRLVTPPGGTLLDPFGGSGSTGKAAELEGFNSILIELEADHVEISRRRVQGVSPLFAEVTA